MRILSYIQESSQDLRQMVKNYPVSAGIILVTTVYCFYLTYADHFEFIQAKTLMSLLLAFVFSVAVQSLSHWDRLPKPQLIGVAAGFITVLSALIFFITEGPTDNGFTAVLQYSGWGLVGLLALFLAINAKEDRFDGFPKWIISLLVRAIFSFLIASTLWIGLSLALLALENLFGFKGFSKNYLRLAILCFVCILPALFLAGVSSKKDWSSWRISNVVYFVIKFVVIPILISYAIILFAYLIKTTLSGSWPDDWVTNLQFWYLIPALITYVLVHGMEYKEPSLLYVFKKWFWVATLPLLAFATITLYHEIDVHGVTPGTYLYAIISVWILGAAVFSLIKPNFDQRCVAIGLILLTIVSLIGPLSLESSVRRSQKTRLTQEFTAAGILKDGIISAPTSTDPAKDLSSDALSILSTVDGLDYLRAYSTNGFEWPDTITTSDIYSVLNLQSDPQRFDQYKSFNAPIYREINVSNFEKQIPILYQPDQVPESIYQYLVWDYQSTQFTYTSNGAKTLLPKIISKGQRDKFRIAYSVSETDSVVVFPTFIQGLDQGKDSFLIREIQVGSAFVTKAQ